MKEEALSLAQKQAWEALIRSHGALLRRMNQRMAQSGQIGLDVYDVLLSLEESPQGRLTMSELTEIVILSPSGVTRLVDRLVKQGFVERECNQSDRRSMYAVLTEAGLQARKNAWPTFHDAIKQEFAKLISDEEAAQLAHILLRYVSPSVGVRIYT